MSLELPRSAARPAAAWEASSAASVVCLVLALLAFATAFALGEQAPTRLFAPETLRPGTEAGGGWFGTEPLRALLELSDPDVAPRQLQPALPLLVQPLVGLLQALLSIDARTAVALGSGATAAGTVALMFLTLRRLGRDVAEAALACLLMPASAAWLFFHTVPSAAPLGAFTVLLVLFVAAGPPLASPRSEALRQGLLGAAVLSVEAANALLAALLGFARLRLPLALAALAGALALVLALALGGLQLQRAGSPAEPDVAQAGRGTPFVEGAGPLSVAKGLVLDPLLAPQPRPAGANPYWQGLSMQHALPGSGSPLGAPALLLWAVLLALGAIALRRSPVPRAVKLVLVGGLAGQGLLQLLRGEETFLHAPQVLPLLVLLASFAFEWAAMRRGLLLAALALVVLAGLHNSRVLAASLEHAAAQGSTRTALLEEIARRPLGPWPRGQAHLLLGAPGAPLASKAYLEPAGAFSPWVGSFGLSFWLTDEDGTLLQPAEAIPLGRTLQRLRLEAGRWPGADFETPLYAGRWQQQPGGDWLLELRPAPLQPGQRLELVLRSVGPAGGPVHRLEASGRTLRVNGRWALDLPAGAAWGLGDEQQGLRAGSDGPGIESAAGWGHARAVLPPNAGTVRVRVRRLLPPVPAEDLAARVPVLRLPDQDFAASVAAQVQHLAMSLEGRETRPGDPLHHAGASLREGAFVVAALARAGNLALARRLAADLAERDFFGAQGSEADAPGLALWALEEVATRVADADFDRELWPHVRRKAGWLLDCVGAGSALLAEPQGPIAARRVRAAEARLLCLPAQQGLVAGRVEGGVPRLYLGALAFRGLADAAALARRLGHEAEAARWSEAAGRLRADWNERMKAPGAGQPGLAELGRWLRAGAVAQGLDGARHAAALWSASRAAGGDLRDVRTQASALWPARVVADEARAEFAERLKARGLPDAGGDGPPPRQPHLDIALAHQWLLLGEPAPALATLRRLWALQVAPGAYSWWDGEGEPQGANGWQAVRGWVEPPHVTPHYRTAAELLALQLDMLTREDDEEGVLIGAGVPRSWLDQPLAAGGIHVRGARVDWRWQDGRMEVEVRGRPLRVRLAAVFPPDTPLAVRHVDAPRGS
ncbi:hypothetical protein [Caldimonas tepidiphila]|uniref:hypothetical protein n=1 Tax=Caldimonas tepidiphila TaxID=2315841 RepID=UPI001300B558|nr:hypothetical protein [Caldimonas tepidiphila]